MKKCSVCAEFFYVARQKKKDEQIDRQTDMTKLIVTFRNFAKTPKMLYLSKSTCPLHCYSVPPLKFCVTQTACVLAA